MSYARVMGQGQGTLSAAAGLVAEARQDLRRLNDEMEQHVEVAGSGWRGRGGEAFVALGRAWSDRERLIVGALDGFEASLLSTERDNTGTDEEQSEQLARQRQRLG